MATAILAPVTHCFLATAPCGCPVSISADREIYEPEVARYVREGYAVAWLPIDEGKQVFYGCTSRLSAHAEVGEAITVIALLIWATFQIASDQLR